MLVRSRLRDRVVRIGAVAAVIVAVSAPATAHAVAAVDCRDVSVPVTLADGSSGPIVGRLCVPDGAATVQVFVHGHSYDQYYFDLPYQPEKYSVARAANRRGHASLTISRLGVGRSYRPLSAQVTLQSNADAVHQVVEALRGGALGEPFRTVVLVGHSYGSLTSWLVAGRYGGVDAVVATGASHRANFVNIATRVVAQSPPAALDPKFADEGLDPGYVTTRPGARAIFYNVGNTDPAVIALDEELKQTGTQEEYVSYLPDYLLTASRRIDVPVLAVNGNDEPYFCNGVATADCTSSAAYLAGERQFYGPSATLEAIIVSNVGHNPTLALSAPQTIARIQDWIAAHAP